MKRRTRFPLLTIVCLSPTVVRRSGGDCQPIGMRVTCSCYGYLSSVKWPPSTPPLQSFLFGNFPFSHLIDIFFSFAIELEHNDKNYCLAFHKKKKKIGTVSRILTRILLFSNLLFLYKDTF